MELGPSHEPDRRGAAGSSLAPAMAMIASTKALVRRNPFRLCFYFFFLHCRARAEYAGAYDFSDPWLLLLAS